jgi:hypothetical protein
MFSKKSPQTHSPRPTAIFLHDFKSSAKANAQGRRGLGRLLGTRRRQALALIAGIGAIALAFSPKLIQQHSPAPDVSETAPAVNQPHRVTVDLPVPPPTAASPTETKPADTLAAP